MTPKEYFAKNFTNAITDYSKDGDKTVLDRFITNLFSDSSKRAISKALRTNFPFSNDYCFNNTIKLLKKKSYKIVKDPIYVGKLRNSMPNCYCVNSDEIDGCLICYTTGMSENVNLFAQAIVSIFMGEKLHVKQEVLEIYTDALLLELERRIHNWYGSKIAPNLMIDMAMELLNDDVDIILTAAGNYSVYMDRILVYHEFAHYMMHRFGNEMSTGSEEFALIIVAMRLYIELCQEENLQMAEYLDEEIMADLIALLLLTDDHNLNHIEIIGVFIVFLQLKKMSADDEYTNKHRLKVVHFFFRNNWAYQNLYDIIEYGIELFTNVFEIACAEPYDEEDYSQRVKVCLNNILRVSSLSETKKSEVYRFYIDKTLQIIKGAEEKQQNTTTLDVGECEKF